MKRAESWQALPLWRIPGHLLRQELRLGRDLTSALSRWVENQVASSVGRTGLVLAVLALALGLFFAAQFQSEPAKRAASSEARSEVAGATIQRLEQEQAELKKAIAEQRAAIATQQQTAASDKTTLAELNRELERQKILAGMIAVKGRGVKVVLDDSATNKIPPSDDPSLYIIHEYQLRDVLNLLWLAGAEAVSLNGERIVATTSIYCVGSTILVNDTRLSPPYEFLAVGDPSALEGAINDANNLKSLKSRAKTYGLQFAVSRPGQVQVPAYAGSIGVKYATLLAEDVTVAPEAGSSGVAR